MCRARRVPARDRATCSSLHSLPDPTAARAWDHPISAVQLGSPREHDQGSSWPLLPAAGASVGQEGAGAGESMLGQA